MIQNDLNVERIIRKRLKRSWMPFFVRFGCLTKVQLQVIPKILDGKNVVIASPTASGKTEAVVAPVAERLATDRGEGLSAIYVVPTRALANDTIARIQGPLSEMGIVASIKHGDKPYLPKKVPHFLVTTPESLDSLICRQSQLFTALRVVIVDEVHLLDNTYRGDQLRLLLQRIKGITSAHDFSVHLLSATLYAPDQVAHRYSDNCEIITVPGQREINYQFVSSHEEIKQLAEANSWKKILYFCNLRESVEAVSGAIAPLWPRVSAHHGSLSRRQREEAEEMMKTSNMAVCVATSTLEVGIDIGDIDLVVLTEVPWSISSLLQRIGRGNRRRSVIQVVGLVSSEIERSMLEEMLQSAIEGQITAEQYMPDLSVGIQQIFSYLYQHPEGAEENDLVDLLSPLCSANQSKMILGHLQSLRWVEERYQERWYASTRLMDEGEKGQIHSNIPDTESYRVIDIESGREIGTVSGFYDEIFVLARQTWKVNSKLDGVIKVVRFSGKAPPATFPRTNGMGKYYALLPPALKVKF